MRNHGKASLLWLGLIISVFAVPGAPLRAELILFVESWESTSLAPGGTSNSLPSPWIQFTGPPDSSQIWHPSSNANFDAVSPVSPPADGNQVLTLSGANSGIYRMSAAAMQPHTIYTLSAAIGNDRATASSVNQFWSLQLWADSNNSGVFEGGGFDTFIGQNFGTSSDAMNPMPGQWALNSFSFSTTDLPGLVGQELIVFLNNYQAGTSIYDQVTLTAAVPEPGTAGVLLGGLCALLLRRRRRAMATGVQAVYAPTPESIVKGNLEKHRWA